MTSSANNYDYETDTHVQKIIHHAAVGATVCLLVRRTPKNESKPSSTHINDADGGMVDDL